MIILIGILTSFYYFPIEFTFLPGVNTKMAMAGVGLVLYALDLAKGRAPQINKDGFQIAVIAALVSLCGLASVIINNTVPSRADSEIAERASIQSIRIQGISTDINMSYIYPAGTAERFLP